ncbi:techylectin-5A-like [Asterias rubens]|uniref:techylectin-5A-like n=1 Tax=Asterias rubens TaxID=7604 RepID=UPI001454FDCE|nr:techylectin-5A-like [Asterias rubens]
MEVIFTSMFLIYMVQTCQSANQQRFINTFYLAENRALLSHVFQLKTVSSPVICGRDCSMDPQCVSFNYRTDNHVCEFNNGTRANSPDDLIESQGSVYYDEEVDTRSFAVPNKVNKYTGCLKYYLDGYLDNGIYTIYPTSLTDWLHVYCDMETDGGGWIVFQRRQEGSVKFNRTWSDYKSGFGDMQNEFWLGNDILRELTGSGQWQLRIDMEDWQSNTSWASYGEFAVTGDNFTLHVGSYDAQSTAGDSMPHHNGHPFSTIDKDNDGWADRHCADKYFGGWWYNRCHTSNLNGEYYQQADVPFGQGLQWRSWKGLVYSVKKSSMKLRQVT